MSSHFEDLIVWKTSHQLTLEIYRLSKTFPKEEVFGITSQIRRSCVSIENNIAEGYGRRTKKDFSSFLYNALGSLYETQSLLMLCKDLHYISGIFYEKVKS